jgi:flagellar protein FliS
MLYNGLVKFIMRGMDSIEKREIQEANTNIIKAQNIVSEFMNTLDMQYELSASLNSIYDYMLRRLIDANVAKDKEILEEVLGFAKILRDTWEQAMKISRHQNRKPTVTKV